MQDLERALLPCSGGCVMVDYLGWAGVCFFIGAWCEVLEFFVEDESKRQGCVLLQPTALNALFSNCLTTLSE